MSGSEIRPSFVVEATGLLSSVQDLGRPGLSHIAVATGGAADRRSLMIGNRIVGNPDNTAAIEMTLVGAAIRIHSACLLCITGAEATIDVCGSTGTYHPRVGEAFAVANGDRVTVGRLTGGVRCYLCVRGGIDVPKVLGSRSTHLAAGFGGVQGRALREGDRLVIATPTCEPAGDFGERSTSSRAKLLGAIALPTDEPIELRVIANPLAGNGTEALTRAFNRLVFKVSPHSNRAGVRLTGPVGASRPALRMASEPMPRGAIQWPGGDELIVLGVDHPTTGGYPIVACLAEVDQWIAGQLMPGMTVRLQTVSLDDAWALHRDQSCGLDQLLPPARPIGG